jgi:Mg2+-importing ATPase
MTDRALARRAVSADIFAEITPDQKERIVAALRRSGKAVGYMGDGINDAPALRAADIGISVDSAVDAAKEAADVVLLRQDLGVLLEGIVIGRTAFANTLKYITITTSANVGNMISMALASLFLPFLPMLATQILLNNLLSDLPLVTISTDRVDEDVVARPGRWDFRQLLRSMIVFGVLSSLFDGLSFAVLLGWFGANEPIFQTGWFIVSLLTEIAVVAVMRTRRPFFTSAPSRLLIIVSVVVAAAALVLPYVPPLADAMDMVALPAGLLAALGAVVVGYVAATELLKRIVWRDQPSRPASRAARIQLR